MLFNKGLSQIYLGYLNEGLAEMEEARKLKVTDEHDVIDDAIRDGGEGYTVFSIVGNPPHISVIILHGRFSSLLASCTAPLRISSRIQRVKTISGRQYVPI